jgi:hypothetical protein
MRSRAAVILTCLLLSLASGCASAGYTTNRRHLSPESCPDAESLPTCEARLDGLSAALADALAPAAPAQGEAVQQSAPATDLEAPPESDEEERARLRRENHNSAADCTAARDLRDRICDLSDAICSLAARDGAPHEIMDKCTSARTSCEHARSEVSNACPKP